MQTKTTAKSLAECASLQKINLRPISHIHYVHYYNALQFEKENNNVYRTQVWLCDKDLMPQTAGYEFEKYALSLNRYLTQSVFVAFHKNKLMQRSQKCVKTPLLGI